MENQDIGSSTRNFDGRWLSRGRRGQRKGRSVGASSVWYGGFAYGKCIFVNFLLFEEIIEAWYRCPRNWGVFMNIRGFEVAICFWCGGAKSMEIRESDLIWIPAMRFGVIFMWLS